MKINQIQPWFDEKEIQAVSDYLRSGGWLTEFKQTQKLEEEIAKFVGTKYCCMMCNGTLTLLASLMAYGIKPKDEIIVPVYTMIATATPITLIGAKPVFVDVERETLCMNLSDFEKKITSKTKAIMLVSINGRYPLEVEEIIESCFDKDIKIIEDAAQSFGSFYHKKHVGTFGEIGSFSFSMPKIISAGTGGCLVTNNENIYNKLKMIKDFGRVKGGVDYHTIIGLNFKYNDILATILLEQMKKLPERIKLKKQIYKWYRKYLEGTQGIQFIETSDEVAPWFVDVLVDNRQLIIDKLNKLAIGTRPFYPSIHSQKPYNWVKGSFPNSTYISEHGLWLPSSSFLTEEQVKYICDCIKH